MSGNRNKKGSAPGRSTKSRNRNQNSRAPNRRSHNIARNQHGPKHANGNGHASGQSLITADPTEISMHEIRSFGRSGIEQARKSRESINPPLKPRKKSLPEYSSDESDSDKSDADESDSDEESIQQEHLTKRMTRSQTAVQPVVQLPNAYREQNINGMLIGFDDVRSHRDFFERCQKVAKVMNDMSYQWATNGKSFKLFNLPRELRNKIYEEFLGKLIKRLNSPFIQTEEEESIQTCLYPFSNNDMAMDLLCCCPKVFAEASMVLLHRVTVVISGSVFQPIESCVDSMHEARFFGNFTKHYILESPMAAHVRIWNLVFDGWMYLSQGNYHFTQNTIMTERVCRLIAKNTERIREVQLAFGIGLKTFGDQQREQGSRSGIIYDVPGHLAACVEPFLQQRKIRSLVIDERSMNLSEDSKFTQTFANFRSAVNKVKAVAESEGSVRGNLRSITEHLKRLAQSFLLHPDDAVISKAPTVFSGYGLQKSCYDRLEALDFLLNQNEDSRATFILMRDSLLVPMQVRLGQITEARENYIANPGSSLLVRLFVAFGYDTTYAKYQDGRRRRPKDHLYKELESQQPVDGGIQNTEFNRAGELKRLLIDEELHGWSYVTDRAQLILQDFDSHIQRILFWYQVTKHDTKLLQEVGPADNKPRTSTITTYKDKPLDLEKADQKEITRAWIALLMLEYGENSMDTMDTPKRGPDEPPESTQEMRLRHVQHLVDKGWAHY